MWSALKTTRVGARCSGLLACQYRNKRLEALRVKAMGGARAKEKLASSTKKAPFVSTMRRPGPVPVDAAMDDAMQVPPRSNGTLLLVGAVLVTAIVLTGGTAAVLALA